MRFGLDDDTPRSFDEIGEILKLSSERIRQIETKALRKLRHPKRSIPLATYYEGNDQFNVSEYEQL